MAGYEASPENGIDHSGFRRLAHLSYMPLPGGDAAIRTPAKTALAFLWQTGIDWEDDLPSLKALSHEERSILHSQLEHRLNTPLTSSMGRLFDAASALAGVRQKVNYEAQAAIEFEAMADPGERGIYNFNIEGPTYTNPCYTIDPAPVLGQVVKDVQQGVPVQVISARFHHGCAHLVSEVCQMLNKLTGVRKVALSGGVWQNTLLLKKSAVLLEKSGFTVYLHQRVPTNDGGLALGQAVIAARRLVNQEN